MSSNKSYIVIFKDDAPSSKIDEEIKKVTDAGGKITQRYDSSIMKGFAAQMPENLVQSYTSLTAGSKHDYLSYIEPDQQVHTMQK
ncbi:uncharacterized protein FA14DRAFT_39994 [Meira miltonrushii]|uniref:Inhibitor I9 domain-containing protein n=1 Tax=Meira miltonrushii TaxID=1280837 RepID=A0A316VCV2_9BASI|nr:uncharacterized protein FA14DRAFT_39994 [Meira miltonrushii]PWN35310.1 hypothetical protein FA14DRAFT_39994 [Meira miltonrushii]